MFSESYELLSDLPLENVADTNQGLTQIIDTIYLASIGVAAAIAVIVLIFAGMQLALSSSGSGRSKWKDRVSGALLGLLILVGAVLVLNTINEDLTKLEIRNSTVTLDGTGGNSDPSPITPTIATTGVVNEEGTTVEQVSLGMSEMSQDEFIETFGREEFDKPPPEVEGLEKIPLSRELYDKYAGILMDGFRGRAGGTETLFPDTPLDESGGGNGNGGGNGSGSTSIPEEDIKITTAGQKMVLAAIKSGRCASAKKGYNIPESWAGNKGLWTIIKKESQGIIGRNNYTITEYAKWSGKDINTLRQDIKSDTFFKKHCCASGGSNTSCNQLKRHNAIKAKSERRKYGHISGKCTSASGIGQLTITNMREYQPGGTGGYLDATSEICGMLNYIRSRYGDPTKAAKRYVNGLGY